MNEQPPLAGRTVLVTGAGSDGIGRAIALALAGQGARLAVHDRTLAQAAGTAALLRGTGASATAFEADFATPAAARALVRQVVAQLGPLHGVVANAGFTRRKPVLDFDDDDFAQLIGVNLLATMALTQEAARGMAAAGGGAIVIVGSVNDERVVPEQAPYCAAKGGLRQWARALAAGTGAAGVRVNLLCPGAIDTPMNHDHLAAHPQRRAQVVARTPLGRFGQPQDLAGAAAFLISDAAAFITGARLVVDGGLSLG